MTLRRMLILLLAVLMAWSAVPVSADALEVGDAWREAVKYVPGSALPVEMAVREDVYWFQCEDKTRGIRYELELFTGLGSLRQLSMLDTTQLGAPSLFLPRTEVEELLAARPAEPQIQGIYAEKQAHLWHWKAYFTEPSAERFFRMAFDGASGVLMGYVMRPGAPEDGEGGFLSLMQAQELGAAHTGGGALTDMLFTKVGERYIYQLSFYRENLEKRVTLDAVTGAVLDESAILMGRVEQASAESEAGTVQRTSLPAAIPSAPTPAPRPAATARPQPAPTRASTDDDDDGDDDDDDDEDNDDDDEGDDD